MKSTINSKKSNVAMEYLKKTAGYLTGAVGEYISDIMPSTHSTVVGAKETITEFKTAFTNTTASILPKMRQLKLQAGFRNLNNWFLQKGDSFDFGEDFDDQLNLDISTEAGEIAETQITEWGKNANQISKTVVESSHKMVEAQITATANLLTSFDRQTAVISSGFDTTNATLTKILEVLTKNTRTLIEVGLASQREDVGSPKDKVLGADRFNFSDYKNIVKDNIKNSDIGLYATYAQLFMGLKDGITPQDVIKLGLEAGVGKFAPKLKDNAKALDKAVGDVILGSLVRLGEGDQYGNRGLLSQIFGIDASRKNVSMEKSSLELKSVPFDSVTKEAITQTIPGYLREILKAVGGPDVTYDYRTRSFKSKEVISKDFRESTLGYGGKLNQASNQVKNALGSDDFTNMVYNMMITELGRDTKTARDKIGSFGKKEDAFRFLKDEVMAGMDLFRDDLKGLGTIAGQLGEASKDMGLSDILTQVTKSNFTENRRKKREMDRVNKYGDDLSHDVDSVENDKEHWASLYGRTTRGKKDKGASIRDKTPGTNVNGVDYSNLALFEIYRILNRGVNVYEIGTDVGTSKQTQKRFPKYTKEFLAPPEGHRERRLKEEETSKSSVFASGKDVDPVGSGKKKDKDGNEVDMTNVDRAKISAKNFGRSMLTGSPEEVQAAFGYLARDVAKWAGDPIKKLLMGDGKDDKGIFGKINKSFGDISGYVKHMFMGGEWTDPVTGKKNPFGIGIFGSIKEFFTGKKDDKGNVLTPSLFNLLFKGDSSGDPEADEKRKKITGGVIGALIGGSKGAAMGAWLGPIGMVVGGLAGSAVATSGLGKKISEMILGKADKPGEKKKGGLVGKIGDLVTKMLLTGEKKEWTKDKKRKTALGALTGILGAGSMGLIGGLPGMIAFGLAGAAFSAHDIGPKLMDSIFGKKGDDGKRVGGFFHKVMAPIGRALGGLGKAMFAPIALIGKAALGTVKAVGATVVKPLIDIGIGTKNLILGGKDKDGNKIHGLVPTLIKNTVGVALGQIGKTVGKLGATIVDRIIDPISDIFFVVGEKLKGSMGNLLIGKKDKDGKYHGGLFSVIPNVTQGLSSWFKDKVVGTFSKLFDGIGSAIKTALSTPFALFRMVNPFSSESIFSKEGRKGIGAKLLGQTEEEEVDERDDYGKLTGNKVKRKVRDEEGNVKRTGGLIGGFREKGILGALSGLATGMSTVGTGDLYAADHDEHGDDLASDMAFSGELEDEIGPDDKPTGRKIPKTYAKLLARRALRKKRRQRAGGWIYGDNGQPIEETATLTGEPTEEAGKPGEIPGEKGPSNIDEQNADNLDSMSESMSNVEAALTNENSPIVNMANNANTDSDEHSIFTHDNGTHSRLDTLIELFGGISSGTGSITPSPVEDLSSDGIANNDASSIHDEKENERSFTDTVFSTGASIATQGGVDNKDEQDIESLGKLSQSDGADKKTVFSKFKSILKRNKVKSEEGEGKEEKKETIFDKIIGSITGLGGSLIDKLPAALKVGGILLALTDGVKLIGKFKSQFGEYQTKHFDALDLNKDGKLDITEKVRGALQFLVEDGGIKTVLKEWWEDSTIGKAISAFSSLMTPIRNIAGGVLKVGGSIYNTFGKLFGVDLGVPTEVNTGSSIVDSIGTMGLASLYIKGASAIASAVSALSGGIGGAGLGLGSLLPLGVSTIALSPLAEAGATNSQAVTDPVTDNTKLVTSAEQIAENKERGAEATALDVATNKKTLAWNALATTTGMSLLNTGTRAGAALVGGGGSALGAIGNTVARMGQSAIGFSQGAAGGGGIKGGMNAASKIWNSAFGGSANAQALGTGSKNVAAGIRSFGNRFKMPNIFNRNPAGRVTGLNQNFTAGLQNFGIGFAGGMAADFGADLGWEWVENKKTSNIVGDYGMGINAGGVVRTGHKGKTKIILGALGSIAAVNFWHPGGWAVALFVIIAGIAALVAGFVNWLVGLATDKSGKDYSIRSNATKLQGVINGEVLYTNGGKNAIYVYYGQDSDRVIGLTKGINYPDPDILLGKYLELVYSGLTTSPGADVLLYDVINNMTKQGVPVACYVAGDSDKCSSSGDQANDKILGKLPGRKAQVLQDEVKDNVEVVFEDLIMNANRQGLPGFGTGDIEEVYTEGKRIYDILVDKGIISSNKIKTDLFKNPPKSAKNADGWEKLIKIATENNMITMIKCIVYINSKILVDDKTGKQWVNLHEDDIKMMMDDQRIKDISDKDEKVSRAEMKAGGMTDEEIDKAIEQARQYAESGPPPEPVEPTKVQEDVAAINTNTNGVHASKPEVARELKYIAASWIYSHPSKLKKWVKSQPNNAGVHPDDISNITNWKDAWKGSSNKAERQRLYRGMRDASLNFGDKAGDIFNLLNMFDWTYGGKLNTTNVKDPANKYGHGFVLRGEKNETGKGKLDKILNDAKFGTPDGKKPDEMHKDLMGKKEDDKAAEASSPGDTNKDGVMGKIAEFIATYSSNDGDRLKKGSHKDKWRNVLVNIPARKPPNVPPEVGGPREHKEMSDIGGRGGEPAPYTFSPSPYASRDPLFNNLSPDTGAFPTTSVPYNPAPTIESELAQYNGSPLSSPHKITWGFGSKYLFGDPSPHVGVDLAPANPSQDIPKVGTEVRAIFPGTVTRVIHGIPNSHTGTGSISDAGGNMVDYKTPGGMTVKNMHLAAGYSKNIKVGQTIKPGDVLGIMGNTGRSSGPHLHYQLEDKEGKVIDPTATIASGAGTTINEQQADPSGTTGDTPLTGDNGDTTGGAELSGETKSKGILQQVIDALMGVGRKFLDWVSGGLFGGSDEEGGGSTYSGSYDPNGGNYLGGTSGSSSASYNGEIDAPVLMKANHKSKENNGIIFYSNNNGKAVEVIDLLSGKSFIINWKCSKNYHTDWSPQTINDTNIVKSIIRPDLAPNDDAWKKNGTWYNAPGCGWTPRPAIIRLLNSETGKYDLIAVGIHFKPHDGVVFSGGGHPWNQSAGQPWSDNLGGHCCMHYGDSTSNAYGGVPWALYSGIKYIINNGKIATSACAKDPNNGARSSCNGAAFEAFIKGNEMYEQYKAKHPNFVPGADNIDTDYSDWQYAKDTNPNITYDHSNPNATNGRTWNLTKAMEWAPLFQATKASSQILPSVRMAQAIAESGFGRSDFGVLGNNIFGMRAGSKWTGEKIYGKDGRDWRKYLSWKEAILDQADNFQRLPGNYAPMYGVEDYIRATELLDKSGYCGTDGYYGGDYTHYNHPRKIIESYGLTYFDNVKEKKKEEGSEVEYSTEGNLRDRGYPSSMDGYTPQGGPIERKELSRISAKQRGAGGPIQLGFDESDITPISSTYKEAGFQTSPTQINLPNKQVPRGGPTYKPKVSGTGGPISIDYNLAGGPDTPTISPTTISTEMMESTLMAIFNVLNDIADNTGTSVDLLDSIDHKEFLDKGLRDTIEAINNSRVTRTRNNFHYNPGEANTVKTLLTGK